jgi:hypothetical protein
MSKDLLIKVFSKLDHRNKFMTEISKIVILKTRVYIVIPTIFKMVLTF